MYRNLHHSNITIDALLLHNNELSPSSDNALSDIIITCKVKWLNITYNNAVGETQHFFATILTDPLSVIEGLPLYHNNYSTTSWAINLFSSLKKNKTLKELWIENKTICDDVCGVICEALRVNNTLRVLDINPITGQASKMILDALKDNNALLQLFLPSYPEDVTKDIILLQQVVNEKRRKRGCNVKLKILK